MRKPFSRAKLTPRGPSGFSARRPSASAASYSGAMTVSKMRSAGASRAGYSAGKTVGAISLAALRDVANAGREGACRGGGVIFWHAAASDELVWSGERRIPPRPHWQSGAVMNQAYHIEAWRE